MVRRVSDDNVSLILVFCSPGCPGLCRPAWLYLPGVGIKGVCSTIQQDDRTVFLTGYTLA